jgi:hypothetical protein
MVYYCRWEGSLHHVTAGKSGRVQKGQLMQLEQKVIERGTNAVACLGNARRPTGWSCDKICSSDASGRYFSVCASK